MQLFYLLCIIFTSVGIPLGLFCTFVWFAGEKDAREPVYLVFFLLSSLFYILASIGAFLGIWQLVTSFIITLVK